MEARQINLLSFISGEDKRLIIPVFQRNYDWKIKQCKKLLNDVLNLINNKTRKSHFIGSIVYISNSDVDMVDLREYLIIDGQQRITTVILLLKAIYDLIEEKDLDDFRTLKSKIYEYYLINKYQKQQNKLRLKPMKDDDIVFQKIMNQNNSNINRDSNIYKNYLFLKSRLANTTFSLKKVFDALQKLMIVYISLKRGEDDPQLIFESINSTGVSLTQADLIRNFILMDKEPKEQERLFENYWYSIEENLTNENISDFIRDYLTMTQKKIPKKSEVYFDFKTFVNNSNKEIEEILEDLKYFSKLYYQILFVKTESNPMNTLLEKINKLKVTVSYPFLLILLNKYYKNKINVDESVESLRIINSYVFRRLICELPSNALNKVFTNLNDDIEKLSTEDNSYSEKLSYVLMTKAYSSSFPTNQEFKMNFIDKNVYSFRHKNYLLEELENFENKEKVNINNLTIEHIMPQNLSPQWKAKLGQNYEEIHERFLHKIGNLTLSGYNGNMSNKPFKQKKEILEKSRLKLNRLIINYNKWGKEEISKRSYELAEMAISIWKYPDLEIKDKRYKLLDSQKYFTFDDEISVTGLQPYSLEILGDKFSIRSWREFFTKTISILYSLDRIKISQLIEDVDFHGNNTKIIARNKKNCRKPYEILRNELYVEVNLSANSILNYTKLIFEKVSLDNSDIKFWIK